MNMKNLELVAKGAGEQWYFNQKQTAILLGCSRQRAALFLEENAVTPHGITGKSKSYFLPDIIAAVEKRRYM